MYQFGRHSAAVLCVIGWVIPIKQNKSWHELTDERRRQRAAQEFQPCQLFHSVLRNVFPGKFQQHYTRSLRSIVDFRRILITTTRHRAIKKGVFSAVGCIGSKNKRLESDATAVKKVLQVWYYTSRAYGTNNININTTCTTVHTILKMKKEKEKKTLLFLLLFYTLWPQQAAVAQASIHHRALGPAYRSTWYECVSMVRQHASMHYL